MAQGNLNINACFAADDANDNNSKKWMLYTSDDGNQYRTQITECLGSFLGFDDLTSSNIAASKAMPQRLKMRTVHFSDASGKITGSYPVGKTSEDIFKEGGKITVARKGKADGVDCFVTGCTGESRTLYSATDTGQQNGDDT